MTMAESVHGRSSCPGCATEEDAWRWVELVSEMALEGDEDAIETLPNVIAHWLEVRHVEMTS
jgi:hypothetical protein